jgi:hypothetical protein
LHRWSLVSKGAVRHFFPSSSSFQTNLYKKNFAFLIFAN